jgi:hypothetical protein
MAMSDMRTVFAAGAAVWASADRGAAHTNRATNAADFNFSGYITTPEYSANIGMEYSAAAL